MTFTTAWLWTLIRSVLLIAVALPCCGWLVRWLRTSSSRLRGWQLAGLLTPVLFPMLLTGYAYSQMTRLLITGWWPREAWFDLLLLLRVVPIGTLLWYFSPSSALSREAWYARVLALRPEESLVRRWGVQCWYWLQGPARTGLMTASGLFLALFTEFELASLLATTSWTVWLFDAQAGGLPLGESLKCCLFPAGLTWLACGALPWLFGRQTLRSADHSANPRPLSTASSIACWSYLAATWSLLIVYPCLLIGREAIPGILALASNGIQARGLAQGILIATGNALITGVLADLIAVRLLHGSQRHGWHRLTILLSGIGLCGSLMISLLVVAVFQSSWLRPLYDTPLPLTIGVVIWLLPRAILLQGMLQSIRSPIAEHAARLLSAAPDPRRQQAARDIVWQIRGRPAVAVRLLLCHWAYWELTLPQILAPAGLVAAPVRLYGDMHFGRNAMLTAKAGLTFAVPLLLVAIFWPWLKKAAT